MKLRAWSLTFLALAVVGLWGVPTSASAASSLTSVAVANGDLVVDKTAVISVAGFLDPADSSDAYVTVQVNSPSLPCLATLTLNSERDIDWGNSPAYVKPGALADVRVPFVPATPGSYVLCAYLSRSGTTYATASTPATVRAPNASLSMALPADRFKSGTTTSLALTTFAEVSRHVSIKVNAAGVACGVSYSADDGAATGNSADILGGPTTVTQSFSVSNTPGLYHLCGYVGLSSGDPAPLVITDGPAFWSGAASCKVGKAPKKKSKSVAFTCTNMLGDIQIRSKRGKKSVTLTRTVVNGKVFVKAADLQLSKKKKRTIVVSQNGKQIGSRQLRLR